MTDPTENPEKPAPTPPVSNGETPSSPDGGPGNTQAEQAHADDQRTEQQPTEQAPIQQPYPQQPNPDAQQPYQAVPDQAYGTQQPYPGQQQAYGTAHYPGAPQQPYAQQPYAQQPYQQQPNGSGQYGVQPPVQKKGIKPWVWWVIGGGAALIVIIVVAVVLLVTLVGGSRAKSTASEYLNDLAKGNAKAANTLARVDTGDKNNALLTNAVLSKAKKISDGQVTRTATSGSSSLTYVYVSFQLDGKTYRDAMELDKDAKGWFVRKGLTYNLPYLSATGSSSDAGYSVTGGTAAVTGDTYEVVAYPGIYTVTAPNDFFELKGSAKITAAPDAPSTLKGVSLTPSQKYVDAVQKQIDAHFDKCAALTDYNGIEDCGIALGYPDNVLTSGSTVAVKIAAYPKVEADDSDGYQQFKLTGGSFSATITGPTWDGGQGTESISADGSDTSASIQIKNGQVTVTFD